MQFSSATEASAERSSILGGVPVEVSARTPANNRRRDPSSSENLYLRGIDENTSRDAVNEALAAFGTVVYVKLYGIRGFACSDGVGRRRRQRSQRHH